MTSGTLSGRRCVTTVDSHTAGHPTRVVTAGVPPLRGDTVAERCEWFRAHHDGLRGFLLHEPRGHTAMVAAIVTHSDRADFGAFFVSTYKYLEMCGHATIGLAVTLDHLGLIAPCEDGTRGFSLEVPAGIVEVGVTYRAGSIVGVRIVNVPAFLSARDIRVETGAVTGLVDIAYGGNWYGLMPARSAGVRLEPDGVSHAMATGARIKAEINARIERGAISGVSRPIDSVLFYDDAVEDGEPVSRQIVVLEDNKFDRSPCGTGTSARLAQLVGRGDLAIGARLRSRNVLGLDFVATSQPLPEAEGPGIRPVIEGNAHITGMHTFIGTARDPLASGFLCR